MERSAEDGHPNGCLREFSAEWFNDLDVLSPMVKDPAFRGEEEFRIIHQLQPSEVGRVRLIQRTTLMSRHLPLDFSPLVPIVGVRIGPCRHKEISRVSVETLLTNNGYATGLVSFSAVPFQQL